ncbi:MAG: response regulator [Myxococcales bacterium FL481]|nr:MAG: response regulator [Myxococcales bacterium FL481]
MALARSVGPVSSSSPPDEAGAPGLSVAPASRDVVAVEERLRRENEQLRRELETTQSQLRAKREFLSRMSHGLRTPLNGVVGGIDLLGIGPLDPEQRSLIDMMRQATTELSGLVDGILDYTLIELGALRLMPKAASLVDVLDESVGRYRRIVGGRPVGLEMAYHDRPPALLLFDALRVTQVVSGLLDNAVKFTRRGQVVLSVACSVVQDRASITLSVRDTGPGIPSERLSKIFEPFVQGEAVPRGTGLGLAMCRQLSELMGGTLEVQTAVGHGSCFTFCFEADVVDRAAAHERPALYPPAAERARGRLLVVDDDALSRRITSKLIRRLGYAVDVARDGEEAVRLAAKHAYRIVLMDYQMPTMDGSEAARRIRAAETPHRRSAIVAVTATTHVGGPGGNNADADMDDVVAKPVTRQTLETLIARWWNQAAEE